MALTWIDEARANLSMASNNYAKIQKELDKYNKLFQTYVKASPETQIRAASVMRQALNEYNSLKAQQEGNAIKMYEAQNWVNYYNNVPTSGQATQTAEQPNIDTDIIQSLPNINIDSGTYEEEVQPEPSPSLNNTTPWSSDILTPITPAYQRVAEEQVLSPRLQAEAERLRNIIWNSNNVRSYASTYKPKVAQPRTQTTIKPATTQWVRNISINRSWPGNVAWISSGSALTWLRYR